MNEPERILILVTSLSRGGIETMIMNYYRRMDRARWQFDFLINRNMRGSYEEEILRLGGRIYRMGAIYPWKYLAYRRDFLRFLKKHPEYRIIHSHLEERSYWPLKLARKAGIPVRVCHAHNIYPFRAFEPKGYFRQWFRLGLRRKGLVTHALACSMHAGKWLYGDKMSFRVIENAIDFAGLAFDAKTRKVMRKELGIGKDERVVGFVGRLTMQKNPEFAMKVFAGLARREEWRMVFVGKGELLSHLQILAKRLGIEEKIILTREVSDVAKYYSAFDVLLMPSLYEGLGMVAVEAGANGLPVVASDKVPRETNVVKNITFLGLEDIGGWQKVVEEISNISRTKKVGGAKIIGKYDINTAVKKLERLYENTAH